MKRFSCIQYPTRGNLLMEISVNWDDVPCSNIHIVLSELFNNHLCSPLIVNKPWLSCIIGKIVKTKDKSYYILKTNKGLEIYTVKYKYELEEI